MSTDNANTNGTTTSPPNFHRATQIPDGVLARVRAAYQRQLATDTFSQHSAESYLRQLHLTHPVDPEHRGRYTPQAETAARQMRQQQREQEAEETR